MPKSVADRLLEAMVGMSSPDSFVMDYRKEREALEQGAVVWVSVGDVKERAKTLSGALDDLRDRHPEVCGLELDWRNGSVFTAGPEMVTVYWGDEDGRRLRELSDKERGIVDHSLRRK